MLGGQETPQHLLFDCKNAKKVQEGVFSFLDHTWQASSWRKKSSLWQRLTDEDKYCNTHCDMFARNDLWDMYATEPKILRRKSHWAPNVVKKILFLDQLGECQIF